MTDKKSSNAVCFKGDRKKEDPLSTEIQRQCQGKMIPSMISTCSIDLAAQDLYTALACHKNPHQPTSLFMKSPFQIRFYTLSSILIHFFVFQGTEYDQEGQKTYKRNLETENPII